MTQLEGVTKGTLIFLISWGSCQQVTTVCNPIWGFGQIDQLHFTVSGFVKTSTVLWSWPDSQ